ncbi:ABC transporter C family member 3 [Hordeum vulgare]|nr:ABC transporter C family member 3 [Hordeum vulgare]
MSLPTIPRRPKVRMVAPSSFPMKRPTTVLTTTMVTRGMKTMTSIAKVMVMVMKMKAMTLILVVSHFSSTSSPKERKRKIDLEEAARQRHLDIEAANVEARKRQLDIEATNAATKAKEVALAIMSVDLTKMSEKTRSWFEARQKEMFDADGLNYVVRSAVAVLFWRLAWVPPAEPLAVCRRETDLFWRLAVLWAAGFVAGEDV